mmetsp:Transcript_1235/g.1270  ORF Transcript_1235/g.1270 Transcript_1235/m.1270 type:complete len:234 (+) Transcript_1235:274-975(+)
MERNFEALDHLNGLFYTGGPDQPGDYNNFAEEIFNYVLKKNDEGQYFPIWGTCLGFEDLAFFIGGDDILTEHVLEGVYTNVRFTEDPATTKMFGELGDEAYVYEDNSLFYQAHEWAVSIEDFDEKLSYFYTATSVSVDDAGEEFIQTMEGKDYPVFATLFHAEKTQFAFWPDAPINHSRTYVEKNRYFADFFVGEARKNLNTFGSFEEEQAWQIENYEEILVEGYFDKIYVFR